MAEGRGWTFAHPFPAVDPDGTWFPIHLAGFTDDGEYIVLGKHALFVRLVGAVNGVGGYAGVLGLSALAQLVAAAASARLAGRIDRRAAVPALWLTGVASPLFLSAYVAWAHTLGAASIGWALVGLTTDTDAGDGAGADPDADVRVGAGIGAHTDPVWSGVAASAVAGSRSLSVSPAHVAGAVALGAAVLVRTEALLAGVAVTAALGWPTVRAVAARRRPRSGSDRPPWPGWRRWSGSWSIGSRRFLGRGRSARRVTGGAVSPVGLRRSPTPGSARTSPGSPVTSSCWQRPG